MAYATTADVAKVITTTEDVSFFLEMAAMVVSEQLEDKGLSDLREKMIEVYLAAHYIAVTDPDTDLVKEKMGEAETTYKTPANSDNYRSTKYGIEAINLDWTGTLESSGRPKATVSIL